MKNEHLSSTLVNALVRHTFLQFVSCFIVPHLPHPNFIFHISFVAICVKKVVHFKVSNFGYAPTVSHVCTETQKDRLEHQGQKVM